MQDKKMESNIFSSVVLEPAVDSTVNVALVLHLVVLVVPVADSDVKGSGLNQ